MVESPRQTAPPPYFPAVRRPCYRRPPTPFLPPLPPPLLPAPPPPTPRPAPRDPFRPPRRSRDMRRLLVLAAAALPLAAAPASAAADGGGMFPTFGGQGASAPGQPMTYVAV